MTAPSERTTFADIKVTDPFTYAQQYLAANEAVSIGRVLPSGDVLFRSIETGRFTEGGDFWAKFRQSYAGGGP
jgi:hypothetical protein